jgi:type VI secretion system protein ImpC
MQIPSMPFKILALAPFRTQEESPWPHEPIRVDKTNLDQIMQDLGLSLHIPLPKNLCPSGGLSFNIKRLKDFHPDRLIEDNPFLKNLLGARRFIEEAKPKGLSDEEIYGRLKAWPDLPIEIKFKPRKSKKGSTGPVDDILRMVAMPGETPAPSGEVQPLFTQIDSLLRQILGHLFSYHKLRDLESVWEGLRFLIKQGGMDGEIISKIIPVSFETLEETLDHLMADLVEDPPSLVIIDLPFDNSPRSLELLEKVAQFAETLMAPTLFWIVSKFFYLDTWQDLKKLSFLPHYIEEPIFAKWRHLKKTPSARWVAAACNRFLVRYPYGPDNLPAFVRFEESENLWVSPVWAIGSLVGQSFMKTGWPTRFTEWQNIRLENLALRMIEGNKSIPTEANFSDERIDQFIRAGIIPLVSLLNKDVAFIPAETTVAGGPFSYQLFLSRITQFLFWCKDNFEKDLETGDLEENLRKAFSLFWERTGHLTPKGLEISVSKPKPEKQAIARIMIEPSRQILPSGEKIELEFNW